MKLEFVAYSILYDAASVTADQLRVSCPFDTPGVAVAEVAADVEALVGAGIAVVPTTTDDHALWVVPLTARTRM